MSRALKTLTFTFNFIQVLAEAEVAPDLNPQQLTWGAERQKLRAAPAAALLLISASLLLSVWQQPSSRAADCLARLWAHVRGGGKDGTMLKDAAFTATNMCVCVCVLPKGGKNPLETSERAKVQSEGWKEVRDNKTTGGVNVKWRRAPPLQDKITF